MASHPRGKTPRKNRRTIRCPGIRNIGSAPSAGEISAGNTLCLYYICGPAERTAGSGAHEVPLRPADDITEFRWFPLDKLPEKIAFEGNARALEKLGY